MKKFYILLLSFSSFLLLHCKEEEVVDCNGLIGPGNIENLLIQHGAGDLGASFDQCRNSQGAYYRIVSCAYFGFDTVLLSGVYLDRFQTNDPYLKPGIIKLGEVPLTQISATGNPFTFISDQPAVLAQFGSEGQLRQYNFAETNVLNQIMIRLPLPFSVNGISPKAIQSEGNIDLTWPADPNISDVFVIVYAYPELGTNADLGLLQPFYKVFKTSDDGAYTISAADLSSLPPQSLFIVDIIRYQTKTFSDSREAARKNMVLALSSVMRSMVKQ